MFWFVTITKFHSNKPFLLFRSQTIIFPEAIQHLMQSLCFDRFDFQLFNMEQGDAQITNLDDPEAQLEVASLSMPQDLTPLTSSQIGLTNPHLTSYGNAFETLQRLRSCPETVDLVLATDDGHIEPVHSYYLAMKAPKFWAQIGPQVDSLVAGQSPLPSGTSWHILYSDESVPLSVPRILVPDISGRMLSIVVSTIYRGEVQLDYDLSWQLLGLAHHFELDMLADTCLDYLAKNLSADNAVQLMQVALKFGHGLASIAYQYILQHFSEVRVAL